MFKDPKNLLTFLALEIATIPFVIIIFKNISPRNVAAIIAGSVFVALGMYILKKSWPYKKSITVYVISLHLFGFALPMLFTRLLYWNKKFEEIAIFGLKGPAFHRLSEALFSILIVGTLIDLTRTLKKKNRNP